MTQTVMMRGGANGAVGNEPVETLANVDEYPHLAKYVDPVQPPAREIVGRDNELQQMMASLNRPELSNILLIAPPGSGKLLPLDTPIPTPDGWTTMGELEPGDMVLGQDGKPTRVSYVSEVEDTPELYELSFSDGSTQVACADHQWYVSSATQRDGLRPSRANRRDARMAKNEAKRQAFMAVRESVAEGEYKTAQEIINLLANVSENTRKEASGLGTYLTNKGVSRRNSHRECVRVRNGVEDVMQASVVEFDVREALDVMSQSTRGQKLRGADDFESVLTTQQMVDAGVTCSDGRSNFAIRVAAPLELPEADLPVDPYVLGVWLGDGRTDFDNAARIISPDESIMEDVSTAGYGEYRRGFNATADKTNEREGMAHVYTFYGLGEDLREAGLDGGKHIPLAYLRASYEQRLCLLQGLMDTDGTVGETGTCELTLSDERLAQDAEELLHTLGIKVNRQEGTASYKNANGERVECKTRHRMVFTTTLPVFKLERKVSCLPETTRSTQELIYVTDIQPVATQPGRCIQVDNDDHMYLCGRSFIPTHNTALVQAAKMYDTARIYMELDLSRMIVNLSNENEMAARLKALFDEAEAYAKHEGRELVIFMDEFHQIVQLSPAAVEALKPVLAASGTRGILVIAATTFEEYHQYIAPNQPLDERLQRINLGPVDREMTIRILRGMAQRYGVADQFYDDHIFELIHEWTERYIPRSTQPRKSIRLLDAMIGWHRYTGELMTEQLLARMLQQQTGMNVAFTVDGDKIKEDLDARVFSQDAATSTLSRRLQLAVADLNDKSRPMFSALFTGSTGVGKANTCSTILPVYTQDGSTAMKRMGDIAVGDYVFDREGNPTQVMDVFPQGKLDVYRVTFTDGRTVDVNDEHLWTLYTAKQRSKKHAGHDVIPMTVTTRELIDRGVVRMYPGSTREHLKFFVPANGAVQWPEQDLHVDPYVLGLLIGNGCLTTRELHFSSNDEYTVQRIADSLGVFYEKMGAENYSWKFPTGEFDSGGRNKLIQTVDVLRHDARALIMCKSRNRRIPKKYLYSSIEQRWALVRGLFDTDGTIDAMTGRFSVSYSTFSKGLAEDVRDLLFSLGVSNSLKVYTRTRTHDDGTVREMVEYDVHVKVGNEDKAQFFALPRKRKIAERAVVATSGRERVKKFDMVGIKSIEALGYQDEMQCIMVDNPEHLYQAGQHIVTHNTEMTKQLGRILFGDDTNRLIRFDMTEFALESSLPMFKTELTQKVTDMGHAVILLDEIEKAHPVITRLLLQILDDGRMRDDYGRQVSFLNCCIIMTTNSGSEVYKVIARYNADDRGSAEAIREYEKVIEASLRLSTSGFPAELLGRLDAIVPFQPLSRTTQRKIIERKMLELRNQVYQVHNVKVRFDPRVLKYLVEDKIDVETDSGGARAAVRVLNDEVATEIAIFLNRHKHVKTLQVSIEGTMRNEDKQMLKSQARVVVREALMDD